MDLKLALSNDNLRFDDAFYEQIKRYKAHLFKWNRVHNLTGAKDENQIDGFIHDALYPITFLPKINRAMDIGTGAGFPGMILAIALPDTHFTLVEPLAKRASFLQYIKADLGLKNVKVKQCRVEELDPQKYDLITSRAVTDTQMLLELSRPFCAAGSLLLFYKGERVYDEVDDTLNYKVIETGNRHYLLIEH